jgi:hypothetical protein
MVTLLPANLLPMIRRSALLVIILSSLIAGAFGQSQFEPVVDTLAHDLIRSIHDSDQEKIFIQTDRWSYDAGDDIWLKAYCIGAFSHKPLLRSSTLFVDVVNDRDSVVALIKLNNASQKLDGRISLPDRLPRGNYWLRAYTPRMLVKDSLSVYIQPIRIMNPEDFSLPASDTGRQRIAFFPEGGAVVAGVEIKFAFTALDQQGKPMDIAGYVTDSNNQVVAKYRSDIPGIGSFSFYPDAGMLYTAHTMYAPGKILVTPLPVADPYGYQISVKGRTTDSVFAQVSLGDSVYKKYRNSYVFVISRDSLCYTAIGKDMYTFSFPTTNIPAGKASIIVFNDRQKIVSQRDIYISKNETVVSITPDRSGYGPRQPVNITLAAGRNGEGDAPMIYSIGVTEGQHANDAYVTSLVSRINQDNVEFPAADLVDSINDHSSFSQWDLIMLTQPGIYLGWEKTKAGAASPEPEGSALVDLRGRVIDKQKHPVNRRLITLLSNNGPENIVETDTTDKDGRFHFQIPVDIPDSMEFYIRTTYSRGLVAQDSIVVDEFALPRFKTPGVLKQRWHPTMNKSLVTDSARGVADSISFPSGKGFLKPAYVTRLKKERPTYDVSKAVSSLSRIIPGDKLGTNPESMEAAFLSTPHVTLQGTILTVRGSGYRLVVDGNLIPLNARPGEDPMIEYLESLNPSNIDFIELLEGSDASAYGAGVFGAVFYVHMKYGGRPDISEVKGGVRRLYLPGYFHAPPFNSPDYDNKDIKQSPYPDERKTIYWNPDITTDSLGRVKLRFFTTDDRVNYSVTAVGLTPAGTIINATAKINGQ